MPSRHLSRATGGEQGTLRPGSLDIDEADQRLGKRFSALHVHGVVDGATAFGGIAPIPAVERAEDLEILDRIVVVVAQGEGNQGLRSQTAASEGLPGDTEVTQRFGSGDRSGCGGLLRRGGSSVRMRL